MNCRKSGDRAPNVHSDAGLGGDDAVEVRHNHDDDRQALRDLLNRIAASLPEDLRSIFLASPRVAHYV